MQNHLYKPPLRLILNSTCNGCCSFCHHEGNIAETAMNVDTVFAFVEAANKLGINDVALTGGEPTLRSDLAMIINGITEKYPNIQLALTTNGMNLLKIGNQLRAPISKVNLSIISLNDKLAQQYQNVNPQSAINSLMAFPALKKNLNIVMLNDNYREVEDFLELCKEKSISLDLMFGSFIDKNVESYVFKRIAELGKTSIEGVITPVLKVRIGENTYLRIKHPTFSSKRQPSICQDCPNKDECFERACAVRVYADGRVTPCLSGRVKSIDNDCYESLKKIYQMLSI